MHDPRQPLRPPAAPVKLPPAQGGLAKITAIPTLRTEAKDNSSIELIDDGESAEEVRAKIKAFGPETATKQSKWTRQPVNTGKGAVRMKTFHAKLSDLGMEYLDDSINRFLDEHPEVDVKFVTTNIGMFDGKFKDLALIVNVWY
jgi:hypothetical protein